MNHDDRHEPLPPPPPFDHRDLAPDLYDDVAEAGERGTPPPLPTDDPEPARDVHDYVDEHPPEDSGSDGPTNESRMLAMMAHVLGLFAAVIGPLVIWLIKKDDDPYVAEEAREALNFQLSVFVASFALGIGGAVLSIPTFGLAMFLVVPLMMAMGIAVLVYSIVAAVAAYEGRGYRYRFTWRFVK